LPSTSTNPSRIDTYSEEYRRITEAITTLKTPLQQRRKYLALVEKKRGIVARRELEAEILKQWKILKGK
jgi:23S rRNA A2030 N6-methylase RlmJ